MVRIVICFPVQLCLYILQIVYSLTALLPQFVLLFIHQTFQSLLMSLKKVPFIYDLIRKIDEIFL